MLKNELFLLKELLPVWKKFADGFVFYDDGSTDGSREYLEANKSKFNILEIISVNHDPETVWVETDIRQRLFDIALKYSTKIICLDADEYLDGRMSKSEMEQMLDLKFNCVFHLRWVQYTSSNTIRVDGPWKNNWKDRIGVYPQNIKYPRKTMHSTHLPISDVQKQIDPNILFISHLQWMDKTFVSIKQYYWKNCDFILKNKFSEEYTPPSAYDESINNFKWEEEYFDYSLKIRDDIYEDVLNSENYRLQCIIDNTKKYSMPNLGDWSMNILNTVPMYFCVASDEKHFPLLMNLIGSIHKFHFYDLVEIGVYDLGLSPQQKNELGNTKKVKLYDVEKTNQKIIDLIKTDTNRYVRGLFSWKPVVIKQSLEKYPYVIYMDAGTTVLKPINNLFKHIIKNGYFLTDCGHSIKWMTPKHVIEKLNVDSKLLDDATFGVDAGFIGISKSMYDSFIKPVYELSFDINNFVDDGTCPNGYGCGRHDQTLFSIFANKLGLHFHDTVTGEYFLNVDEKKIPFNVVHATKNVTDSTDVFRSRWNLNFDNLKINLSNIKRKYVVSVITGIGSLEKYEKFVDKYFNNIQEQILFPKTEHIIVYSEWSSLFDKFKLYPNIIFIKEQERLGVYNAWNIGILHSTSNYITNWNVDDLRHPINTKIKYDLLSKNSIVDMAYNFYVASSTDETFDNIDLTSKSIVKFPDDYHMCSTVACLAGPDPMWRKCMHYKVGMFDYERFSVAGDWDMWIRFAKAGFKFKLIPEVMCIYSVHPNTVSQQMNIKLDKEKQLIHQLYN